MPWKRDLIEFSVYFMGLVGILVLFQALYFLSYVVIPPSVIP